MRYGIPGLGGRLRRARNATGLSQEKVADRIGVSWMTVHRWERSQRSVPDHLLDRLCELYDRSLSWFLTLEDGDLDQPSEYALGRASRGGSTAVGLISQRITDAPDADRLIVEKVVEDLVDGLRRVS